MTILNSTRAALGGAAVATLAVAGVGLTAAPAHAASTATWDKIASCESGGNWKINTGNGYYGGLQFSLATWRGFGGTGMPHQASKAEQIRIAERTLAVQGWNAWPTCSKKFGLYGKVGANASSSTTVKKSSASSSSTKKASSAKRAATVKLSGKTYTVKSGDTLHKIAKKLGVRGGWAALADANVKTVKNPNVIYVGQKLQLPA